MSGNEPYSLGEAEFVGLSDKSIWVNLIDLGLDDENVPISQIHDDSEIWEESSPGDVGELVVNRWLAEARGWT